MPLRQPVMVAAPAPRPALSPVGQVVAGVPLARPNVPPPPALAAGIAPVRAFTPASRPAVDWDQVDERVLASQRLRAADGSAQAQYDLALRYMEGRRVERDAGRAREWLAQSAQNGFGPAITKMRELALAAQ